MRERRNPDDFRRRRVVGAAMLWAMLCKEFVQHVLTEVRRAQYASVGERSLHKEGEPDQMIQRRAELLQIGFYVREDVTPLCRRVSYRTGALFEWLVTVSGCRVAGQKDKSFRSGDDRALAPWHQTAAFELLVSHEIQFSPPTVGGKAGGACRSRVALFRSQHALAQRATSRGPRAVCAAPPASACRRSQD